MSASARGSSEDSNRRRPRLRPWITSVVALACCGIPTLASAHPYHVTFTEANLDTRTWTLQLAIRMKPEDLQEALRRRAGSDATLESFPQRDLHAYAYLAANLSFERQGLPPLPIRWVGMEVSLRDAWVYLEVPLPSATRALTVHDKIFFDLETNQANTVELRLPSGRTTLTFRHDQPSVRVEIPPHPAR